MKCFEMRFPLDRSALAERRRRLREMMKHAPERLLEGMSFIMVGLDMILDDGLEDVERIRVRRSPVGAGYKVWP